MLAQIIALSLIAIVALILAAIGLTIKSEKDKFKKTWRWLKKR